MNFFVIFSSSFQKVQPKCASEKKDFRLSIKRKQSCQVKKKEEFLMPLKKPFIPKNQEYLQNIWYDVERLFKEFIIIITIHV